MPGPTSDTAAKILKPQPAISAAKFFRGANGPDRAVFA